MNLDWQLVSEDEPIKVGWRKLQRRVYKMPNGNEEEFILNMGGPFVCVLPQLENGNFILAKQFRPGPGKIMYELPGGAPNKNESLIDAARRELMEETGYEDGAMEFVGSYAVAATSTVWLHAFIATDCRKKGALNLDETEFIEPVEVSLEELKKLLLEGKITETAGGFFGLTKLGLL